ncbi:Tetraspanin-11 [Trichoplax sp. H2]|nr:Tetraspanin-11 [Trichoplax sp. H2]|eukprot:RDD39596.1 Tetraspanin-11 [Trichoplax sp. H2]
MGFVGCLRVIFYIFTLIFVAMGIALLAMGIIIRVNSDLIGVVADNSWFTAAYIMIAAGVFIFLVALVGFCGARNSNKCMLGIYLGVLVVIFILEIAGAIYGAVNRVAIEEAAKAKMTTEVQIRYGQANQGVITDGFNKLQTTFQCCGVNTTTDWYSSAWISGKPSFPYGPAVPDSCCRTSTLLCGVNSTAHANAVIFNATYYSIGCYQAVRNSITNNLGLAIGVLGGFAGVQVLGMILAGVLIAKADEEE